MSVTVPFSTAPNKDRVIPLGRSMFREGMSGLLIQTLAHCDVVINLDKIDAYTYVEKAPDDLTPRTKENLTLEELMKTWMAHRLRPATCDGHIHSAKPTVYD